MPAHAGIQSPGLLPNPSLHHRLYALHIYVGICALASCLLASDTAEKGAVFSSQPLALPVDC